MCGIVGAVARRNIVPILLEGLRKLEYRGYDSAGLAVVNGGMHRLRSVGRVASLTEMAGPGQGCRATLASRIRAGPRMGRRPSATRTPMSATTGWRWCITASSKTTKIIRERLATAGYRFSLRYRHRSRRASGPPEFQAQRRSLRRRARGDGRIAGRLRNRRAVGENAGHAGGGAQGRAAAAGPGQG